MGVLTDDMARLHDEIDALHDTRKAFIRNLNDDVSDMQTGFRNTHAEMARSTKADRLAFETDRKTTANEK